MEKKFKIKNKTWFLLVTLVPAFGFYCLFTLSPNLLSIYYSFLEWDGITEKIFVGLENYRIMLTDPYVIRGIKNSLLIMVITMSITMALAILLAFAITNTKFRENNFYRALFYFPNVIPMVMTALLWSFIYDGDMGLLNGVLELFNSDLAGKYWLADKSVALYCIMVPMIWCNVGFHMIIIINAMTTIPQSLYEVAIIGGASMFQKMRYITLPLIRETLVTCGVFLILGSFNNFEIIMLMTQGGPGGSTSNLAMYMYNLAFAGKNAGVAVKMYGYSSAIGILLMVILMTLRGIFAKLTKGESVEF